MADDEVSLSITSKGTTRLKTMCMKINKGKKISLPIDVNTGVTTGLNANNFSSYLGVVARERISILTYSWDYVTEHKKNMIWQDILVCNCFYFVQYEVYLYFVQSKVYLYFVQSEVYYDSLNNHLLWYKMSRLLLRESTLKGVVRRLVYWGMTLAQLANTSYILIMILSPNLLP